MIKMLNQYLLCVEIKSDVVKTGSGFETQGKEERFKELQVTHSAESDITEGCKITVPSNSGAIKVIGDVDYTVVKRGDVIWFE
tara:strand:+ start:13152 stop:13400 length:249 start_codon:yes stop_codon:yes gene_type:complete